jgi:hypothetical protein
MGHHEVEIQLFVEACQPRAFAQVARQKVRPTAVRKAKQQQGMFEDRRPVILHPGPEMGPDLRLVNAWIVEKPEYHCS